MTNHNPITDNDLREVTQFLEEAVAAASPEARHDAVARTVRSLTRVWANANPDFDGDAWYAVSFLLTEHWDQIRRHMAEAGTS